MQRAACDCESKHLSDANFFVPIVCDFNRRGFKGS